MTGVYIMLGGMVAFVTLISLWMPSADVKDGVSKKPNSRRVEALHAIVVAVH